jgi:hypothetical protein
MGYELTRDLPFETAQLKTAYQNESKNGFGKKLAIVRFCAQVLEWSTDCRAWFPVAKVGTSDFTATPRRINRLILLQASSRYRGKNM